MIKIIFQLAGFIKKAAKPLGELQLLVKAPVNLGRVDFKISLDKAGDQFISGILKKLYGKIDYKKLINRRAYLVVE